MEKNFENRLVELEEYGLFGPDFLMGAQAEALKAASNYWPLKDPQGKMTSEEILEFIMDQAVGYAINYLTRKVAPQIVGMDAPTKFYVLFRHLFGDLASYDDTRRIALACLGASGIADPVVEIGVSTGLGKMTPTQISGESTKVFQLLNPWQRMRQSKISRDEDATVIDWVHTAVSLLEDGKDVMEAAEAISHAGKNACEVIRALYQILPDRVTQEKTSKVNRESPKPIDISDTYKAGVTIAGSVISSSKYVVYSEKKPIAALNLHPIKIGAFTILASPGLTLPSEEKIKKFLALLRKIVESIGGNPDTVKVMVTDVTTEARELLPSYPNQIGFNVNLSDRSPIFWLIIVAREFAALKYKRHFPHVKAMTLYIEKALYNLRKIDPDFFKAIQKQND